MCGLLSGLPIILAGRRIFGVPAVPAMHEDVQEGAGQDQKPERRSKRVGAVLGRQQEADNDEEDDEDNSRPRAEKATLPPARPGLMMMFGHETFSLRHRKRPRSATLAAVPLRDWLDNYQHNYQPSFRAQLIRIKGT
jgi:hypothetical protein